MSALDDMEAAPALRQQITALQAENAEQQKKLGFLDKLCLMHEETAREVIEHAKKLEAELAALKAARDYYRTMVLILTREYVGFDEDDERFQTTDGVIAYHHNDWKDELPTPPVGQEGV